MTEYKFDWCYIANCGRHRTKTKEDRKRYQHEYYMRVTKKKRAERKKHD